MDASGSEVKEVNETKVLLPDGRTVSIDEIGGLAEVADHYGWNHSTLTTWVNRYADVPTPAKTLRRGALYVISDWDGWRPGEGEDRVRSSAGAVA
jgi:hypothetical protein